MSETQSTVEYCRIKGHPGYRVGSDGSVWSQWHKVGKGYRSGFATVIGEWFRMKPNKLKTGYLIATLYPGPKYKSVHRLVLEAFVGPCPEGMEACHDPDPCRGNNSLLNLRWGTKTSNCKDRDMHGNTAKGEKAGGSKLTKEQAIEIKAAVVNAKFGRKTIKRGTLQLLAKKFNVTTHAISRISRNKTWKHLFTTTTDCPVGI